MELPEARIQYVSDLHLEFSENEKFLNRSPIKPEGEILILAGDIVPLVRMKDFNYFFDQLSDDFETVFWIPGNHEYYHYDAGLKCGSFKEKIRNNIWFLNNQEVILGEYRMIFSTLWANISVQNSFLIQQNLNDFRMIEFNGKPFTPELFNTLFEENHKFIKDSLQQKTELKTVVVTHHIPTLLNYPKKYRTSPINEAFAVELYDLIEIEQPSYWIYGHHHCNTPDFKIGDTQLLTNQLGYVAYREHQKFQLNKTIDNSLVL